MEKQNWYVLFPNHENGLMLYQALKAKGMKATIVPTPRKAQKSCGISLLVEESQLEAVQDCIVQEKIQILRIISLSDERDAARDKYC